MDPKTGAILAMASSPDYDLNNYSEVLDQELQNTLADLDLESEEYSDALNSALLKQWSNKALNTSYEPGSTFKSIVLAAALEEGVTSLNDTFYCSGQITVDTWSIRCSKREGHGAQSLAEAVGNSCNPAFITIGQRLGTDTFYDYLEDFGFTEITGIDLPGEQAPSVKDGGTLWPRSSFNITQLATASFGQRFQTTPIQLITAVAATINGGYLYTPYVVQSITDSDGNVIEETEPNVVRQVISEETSAQVARILENVVDGCITGTGLTGKNAYTAGYRIGGKTGSSQTLEEDHTIVSFVGFAPADDPQVIILFALDSPRVLSPGSDYCTTGTYISGGAMAAPAVGELLPDILDYLGVERVYQSSEVTDTTVPQMVGGTLDNAAIALKEKNLTYRTVGDGESITGQIPSSGASIPSGSEVILYLGEAKPTDTVTVPKLTGMTLSEAQATLEELDLYLKPSGANSYSSDSTRISSQSLSEGVVVERGTVVTVHFSDSYVGDNDADSASDVPTE
jgi:stage V sporulation protein D (sporulation-specific penicillin-binding protein)